MPTPVPPGKFAEYAACLSEGFCPSCRQPVTYAAVLMPGINYADCARCRCLWRHDRRAVSGPLIGWRGIVDADGTTGGVVWDIWTHDDRVFGGAEWAE
jgi:hypothetical protein